MIELQQVEMRYVANGATAATHSGGELLFDDPESTEVAVPLRVRVGFSHWPGVIQIESRFADSSGGAWRATEFVTALELYQQAIRGPLVAGGTDTASRTISTLVPPFDAVNVSTVVADAPLCADSGELRPLLILRERPGWSADRDRYERIICVIHEHNFHARLDIVEVRRARARPVAATLHAMYVLIRPLTSPVTSTAVSDDNQPIEIARVDLADLGPLSRPMRLGMFLWRGQVCESDAPELSAGAAAPPLRRLPVVFERNHAGDCAPVRGVIVRS